MNRLSLETVYTQSIRLHGDLFDSIASTFVVGDPNLETLENYNFSPDQLRADGEDVPSDESDALEFAFERFKETSGYDEWRNEKYPVMTSLWPLPDDHVSDETALATALQKLDLAIVYVAGDEDLGSGFMLTGGGQDLSDHIAMAYIAADCVPPLQVQQSAIAKGSDGKLDERFWEAVDRTVCFLKAEINNLERGVERYKPTENESSLAP